MQINASAILIVAAGFTAGCNAEASKNDSFGRSHNETRKLRMIPIIPDSWAGIDGGREANWTNPSFANSEMLLSPMHARKYVAYDSSNSSLYESDYYYSGRKYKSQYEPNQLDNEMIIIYYNYIEYQNGNSPWKCVVNCGPHFKKSIRQGACDGNLSLVEAEAILTEWGISRLNY